MTFEEIEKKVKSLLALSDLGFHDHIEQIHGNRLYSMTRRSGEAIHRIRYDFYPPLNLEQMQFNWMRPDIIFPEVNRILQEAWGGVMYTDSINQPLLSDPHETTVWDDRENNMAIREFLKYKLLFFIEDGVFYEDRLADACRYQREAIDRFMLPFFEQFGTLQAVNDQLVNPIRWEDLADRIAGQTPLKRLIIMKICENPGYLDFADMFEARIRTAVERSTTEYESFYAALKALRNYLDTGRYRSDNL